MKSNRIIILLCIVVCSSTMVSFYSNLKVVNFKPDPDHQGKRCVFNTVMGLEDPDTTLYYPTPEKAQTSLTRGLQWMVKAQQSNGGWGAGSHYNQGEMNPLAVKTDPATTSMVAMALLRSGSTPESGPYAGAINKAMDYLMTEVENAPSESFTITSETHTQIQTKLGANIDVVLSAQFFNNVIAHLDKKPTVKERVKKCLGICVDKIQKAQDADGSTKGSGWAGVLQSSFANNALEAARQNGVMVDSVKLQKSMDYQKSNLNTQDNTVKTDRGAGIVLYSVSSSTRASAADARKVEDQMKKAKESGKLANNAPVNTTTLEQAGFSKSEAQRYATSYDVYKSGKVMAQDQKVMSGFGNNGGEEFMSFLQTGESMIIGRDQEWKKWYDNISATLLNIQNQDGSWNGHHCITSPVFCTATCVLILSVNNDVKALSAIGN